LNFHARHAGPRGCLECPHDQDAPDAAPVIFGGDPDVLERSPAASDLENAHACRRVPINGDERRVGPEVLRGERQVATPLLDPFVRIPPV
jgi:hypothetical protein